MEASINQNVSDLATARLPCGPVRAKSLPSLSGVFMGIGGDIMFTDKFGAGPRKSLSTPAKHDYGPLEYRQDFYRT